MSGKPFLARLDDLARLTGIPALAEHQVRRRRVRLPSTLALLLGFACLAWSMAAGDRGYLLSYGLSFMAFLIAGFMPICGPVKPWGGSAALDERERTIQSRAYLAAFGLLAGTAYLALFLISGLALMHWPIERLTMLLAQLAFLLATIYAAGPACFASWAEPPIIEGE